MSAANQDSTSGNSSEFSRRLPAWILVVIAVWVAVIAITTQLVVQMVDHHGWEPHISDLVWPPLNGFLPFLALIAATAVTQGSGCTTWRRTASLALATAIGASIATAALILVGKLGLAQLFPNRWVGPALGLIVLPSWLAVYLPQLSALRWRNDRALWWTFAVILGSVIAAGIADCAMPSLGLYVWDHINRFYWHDG